MSPKALIFSIIILLACLPQVATDIYTPSLPTLANAFGVKIDIVQWSIAVYVFGVASSQLIYGPLSEGLGRRLPLFIGSTIFLIGSLFCVFAPSIELLITGRLIQGLGAGACTALWRSIFRDTFHGAELSKYASYSTLIVMFVLPSAPVLGGYLQHTLGWRSTFIFLTLYCLIVLMVLCTHFKETNQHHHKDRLKKIFIIATFKSTLIHPIFMGYASCALITFASFFAWVAIGPVLLIAHLNVTPVAFGWISCLVVGLGMGISSALNSTFVKYIGVAVMLRLGWGLCTFSGILLITCYMLFGMTVLVITLPVFVFYTGVFLVWPNIFSAAFEHMGSVAGYAGAIYGCMQMIGGALITAIIAYLPDATPLPLGIIYIVGCGSAWLWFELKVKPAEKLS